MIPISGAGVAKRRALLTLLTSLSSGEIMCVPSSLEAPPFGVALGVEGTLSEFTTLQVERSLGPRGPRVLKLRSLTQPNVKGNRIETMDLTKNSKLSNNLFIKLKLQRTTT